MIAALYSSRPSGSKRLTLDVVQFGWETIEKVYNQEMERAEMSRSRKVLDWSTLLSIEIIGLILMWDQARSCRWLNLFVLFFLKIKVTSDNEILFKSLWHPVSVFFYWNTFLCRINHQYVWYKYLLLLFISLLCTRLSTKQRPWINIQALLLMLFFMLLLLHL